MGSFSSIVLDWVKLLMKAARMFLNMYAEEGISCYLLYILFRKGTKKGI